MAVLYVAYFMHTVLVWVSLMCFLRVCSFVMNSECRDHVQTSSHHGVTEAPSVASGRNY